MKIDIGGVVHEWNLARWESVPPRDGGATAGGVAELQGPEIAQTLVGLGVDLTAIPTFSNLREALRAFIAGSRPASPRPKGAESPAMIKELSR